MTGRQPLRLRVAHWAGTAVRLSRPLGRIVPGVAGAVLASVGVGELAGHVFGRGLAPWVACTVASVFLLVIGREVNSAPRPMAPRNEDYD